MIQELEEAGLTRNEGVIYVALLELGTTTAGPLTKKTNLHRSRVYESLNRLIEQGLVSYTIKANRKWFHAQNPETMLEVIEEKKQKIKSIIPYLQSLQKVKIEKHEATMFEGYKGLKSIFDNAVNVLEKGDEILVMGARSGQDVNSETWNAFFNNFNRRRIEKRIIYKIIFNDDLRKSKVVKLFQKSPFTEVRFISQHTPAGINIHKDNVAIIIWRKTPYAFLITSKEVAQSFREYFKVLWKQAEKSFLQKKIMKSFPKKK